MSTCRRDNASVSERANYCGNCRAVQPQTTSEMPLTSIDESNSRDMVARLEKAMRRAELLGYAAAALAVAILAVIIGIAFL